MPTRERNQSATSRDLNWKAGVEQQSTTTYSLSGTVTSAAAGALVNISGAKTASVTADSSGNYTFSGLSAGSYVVVPVLAGHTFTPVNKTVTIAAPTFLTTTNQTNEGKVMNEQFDDLAKGMAQSVTRRGALKKLRVGLAGIALATLGLANDAHANKAKKCGGCAPPYFGCDPLDGACQQYCFHWCQRKNGGGGL